MIELEAPFTEDKIRALKMGDMVEISGVVFTGRDAVHKWLHEGNLPPVSFKDGIIYHCGPVVMKKKGKWVVTAAGPTTSIREEPYQAGIIEKFGVRAVIGKGGMGDKTRIACEKFGCVYSTPWAAPPRCSPNASRRWRTCTGSSGSGAPKRSGSCAWRASRVVVTIDAHGNSLHKDIEAERRAQSWRSSRRGAK